MMSYNLQTQQQVPSFKRTCWGHNQCFLEDILEQVNSGEIKLTRHCEGIVRRPSQGYKASCVFFVWCNLELFSHFVTNYKKNHIFIWFPLPKHCAVRKDRHPILDSFCVIMAFILRGNIGHNRFFRWDKLWQAQAVIQGESENPFLQNKTCNTLGAKPTDSRKMPLQRIQIDSRSRMLPQTSTPEWQAIFILSSTSLEAPVIPMTCKAPPHRWAPGQVSTRSPYPPASGTRPPSTASAGSSCRRVSSPPLPPGSFSVRPSADSRPPSWWSRRLRHWIN